MGLEFIVTVEEIDASERGTPLFKCGGDLP